MQNAVQGGPLSSSTIKFLEDSIGGKRNDVLSFKLAMPGSVPPSSSKPSRTSMPLPYTILVPRLELVPLPAQMCQ
uniref:Uncharacterized protein n=1 Tax=Tetraselmis sp. GSL018 TaxID=582737 RepID=A0A061R741_9CHLO